MKTMKTHRKLRENALKLWDLRRKVTDLWIKVVIVRILAVIAAMMTMTTMMEKVDLTQ